MSFHLLDTRRPIAVTLGGCEAEAPRVKCSVEWEVVWMSGYLKVLQAAITEAKQSGVLHRPGPSRATAPVDQKDGSECVLWVLSALHFIGGLQETRCAQCTL